MAGISFAAVDRDSPPVNMREFHQLYSEHIDSVFRYAVRCVGRREIAEEIASEAFLALYRNRDRIDEAQLPAWLLTVTKNRATDYWRRQSVEQRYASALADLVPKHSGTSRSEELFDNPALKPGHRLCLVLRYVHGMNRSEIAKRTGFSEDQVKSRLQYALRLLRDQLVPYARGAK